MKPKDALDGVTVGMPIAVREDKGDRSNGDDNMMTGAEMGVIQGGGRGGF